MHLKHHLGFHALCVMCRSLMNDGDQYQPSYLSSLTEQLRGKEMNRFWEGRFEELAAFNSDRDKSKYTDDHLKKMNAMQEEYNSKQKSWARDNGYIAVGQGTDKVKKCT